MLIFLVSVILLIQIYFYLGPTILCLPYFYRPQTKGNVFTYFCDFVHDGGGVSLFGRSLSGGSLTGGSLSEGGVSVRRGDLCPRGSLSGRSLTRGGLCPGGSLSRGRSLSKGRSLSGRPSPTETLPSPGTVKSGQYASYWNAFLFYTSYFKKNLSVRHTVCIFVCPSHFTPIGCLEVGRLVV